jgi:transglutaminase-like putative cysteine protease
MVGTLILWTAAVLPVAAAASVPPWVQSQVNAPVPQHDEKTNAALFYSESVVTVQPDGQRRHFERRIYRILRNDGEHVGVVRVDFDPQTSIKSLNAWSIPKEGKPYEVGMREALETSLLGVQNGELVTDLRTKLLRIPASIPGSVVAYEVETLEKPRGWTEEWLFEDTVPIRETHFTLKLPPEWSFKATWLNHPDEAPSSTGSGQTEWVLKDLKEIRPEEDMPPWRGIAGRLVVALIPPNSQQQGFQNWREMGVWYQTLVKGRTDSSQEIKQMVATLTQSAPSKLEKMRALASFVQKEIRYVAIELGIGGLQPHAAAEVFAHRYGDCKDKATLLSAMLKEIGVDSYYFIINTARGSITASTPANLGFNHMILAIQLPPGTEDSSLLAASTHPKLGKLLFFDPTAALTPLGALSGELQANYGLLVAPDGGELIRTPQLPVEVNAIERTAKMTLDENGTLHGDIREVWSGDMASLQRAATQAATQDTDLIKPVERVAAESFSTYSILKAVMANARANDRPFEWRYTVEAPQYAKSAGELLLVRPRIIGTKASGMLETPEPRHYPIEFNGARRDTDSFEIALPAGYEIDEVPPPVDVDYGFVAYHSKTESVGRSLRYTRTFERRELSVPVSKAEELKKFYRIISDDERNSAVLRPSAGPSATP